MAKAIKTTIEIDGYLKNRLTKAFETLEQNTESLNRAFQTMEKVGVAAAKGVAVAVAGIATAMVAAAESTRDYRKDLAKMYNNAELAGVAQEEAWSGLESLYAMSGEFDSANEAMSNLLATGYKGKDLEKIIEAVNGATIKWQDTVTQESLADAINETVMSGKSMGQFDEILSRSGVRIEEFNDGLLNCNGLAERQQYVLSWLAKSGLTEVNEAYREQNKSLVEAYEAELALQNSMAELGRVAEPLITAFKNLGSQGLAYITEKLKDIDLAQVTNALKRVGELGKQAFDTLWNALSKIDWESLINSAVTVLTVFTEIFNFVVNNWSTISPIIFGIVGALVAYKAIMVATSVATKVGALANGIYMAALDLMTGGTRKQAMATFLATTAQNGLNLAFLASPVTWIVLAIFALVAAFVVLWNKSEKFREFWIKVWDGIKSAVSDAWDWIKGIFDKIDNFFSSIGDWFDSLFGGGGQKTITVKAAKVKENALGSTITSPTLTWVGEGGDTETIVPHNNKPRSQALALEALRGTGLSPSVVNNASTTNGGSTFVFSPTIYANGSSEDVQGILDDAIAQFKAQMEEWARSQRRLSY